MTSWKTSLGGVLASIGAVMTTMTTEPYHTIGVCLAAVGALLLGVAAKDFNVTGGTKHQ